MRIAHLSDLHFGAEIPEAVDALLIRLLELDPDLVVISGDFTMAARHAEFDRARAFLERLPMPVIATPGNHDIPVYNPIERFARPFRRYTRCIAPITEDRFASPGAALLSANSARPWDISFNWSHGRLSDKQIDEADRFFADNRGAAFKALVAHHPFVVPEDLPGFRTIRNGDAMLDILARHRVHAVLSGHLHRQFTTTRTIPLEADNHEIALLQVATATSSRRRDQPNAFAVIHTDPAPFRVGEEIWNGTAYEPHTQTHSPHRSESRQHAMSTIS